MHAFLLGAELASQGHAVTFVCNRPPGFLDKLPEIPGKNQVKFKKLVFNLLRSSTAMRFDLWITVQERSINGRFFAPVFENARRFGTPITVLTFETPNWQESMGVPLQSPEKDSMLKEAVRLGAQVIVSTTEGRGWAEEYFSDLEKGRIHVLSPPIMASFFSETAPRDERLVVCFARPTARHKGFDVLTGMIDQRFKGWKFAIVLGGGASFELELFARQKRAEFGVEIELYEQLSEYDKYRLLKSARVLVFPSMFEGFGLPPGEALFFGTPVVAYGLPVLKCIYGNAIGYAEGFHPEDLSTAFWLEVESRRDYVPASSALHVGDFTRWKNDVRKTIDAIMAQPVKTAPFHLAGSKNKVPVVLIDQIMNWNKEDAAASAGCSIAECEIVSFDMPFQNQLGIERGAIAIDPNETLLPPGKEKDGLRLKLLEALLRTEGEFVFISEDTIVCPFETILSARDVLFSSGDDCAAIGVRVHYQEDGNRFYRSETGSPVAACGVFKKSSAVKALESSTLPGCRLQPVLDLSYLLLANGFTIVQTEFIADRLPPRSEGFEFDGVPGGAGTWHNDYLKALGINDLVGPLPCRGTHGGNEHERLIKFRRELSGVLCDYRSQVVISKKVHRLIEFLVSWDRNWNLDWRPDEPERTYDRIWGSFIRYGQAFVSVQQMNAFLLLALVCVGLWKSHIVRPLVEEVRRKVSILP